MKRSAENPKKLRKVSLQFEEIKNRVDAAQTLMNDILDLESRVMDHKRRKQELDEELQDVNERVKDLEETVSNATDPKEKRDKKKRLVDLKNVKTKMSSAQLRTGMEVQKALVDFEQKHLKLMSSLEKMDKELRKTGGKAMAAYRDAVYQRTKRFATEQGGGEKLLGNLSGEQLFGKSGYDLDTWKGV